MAESPFLTDEKRDYMKTHDLESTISTAINNLMKEMPENSNSFLSNFFAGLSDDSINLVDIQGRRMGKMGGGSVIIIVVEVEFKGTNFTYEYRVNGFGAKLQKKKEEVIEEEGEEKKEVKDVSERIMEFLNGKAGEYLKGKNLANLNDFDEKIKEFVTAEAMDDTGVSSMLSSISPQIYANLTKRKLPQAVRFYLTGEKDIEKFPAPFFVFKLITGGPDLCPKFKPASISIYQDFESKRPLSNKELVLKISEICSNLRSIIAKGKGGQALLKEYGDGSLVSPFDNCSDAFKVLDEALNQSEAKDNFLYWIDFDAQKYWNQEIEKYHFENPKKPSDPDDLEDALFKILADRKSVGVIQDPFSPNHNFSWHKLNAKLTGKERNIKFASKYLYNTTQQREAFHQDITEDKFPPKAKNVLEMIQKINRNKAQIEFRVIDMKDYPTGGDLNKTFNQMSKFYEEEQTALNKKEEIDSNGDQNKIDSQSKDEEITENIVVEEIEENKPEKSKGLKPRKESAKKLAKKTKSGRTSTRTTRGGKEPSEVEVEEVFEFKPIQPKIIVKKASNRERNDIHLDLLLAYKFEYIWSGGIVNELDFEELHNMDAFDHEITDKVIPEEEEIDNSNRGSKKKLDSKKSSVRVKKGKGSKKNLKG